MEETQERSLQREAVKIEIAEKPTPFVELDPEVQLAIKCAADKKAFDLVALDLRDIASFTEFFIIASGSNQRQVQAIANAIEETLLKEGVKAHHVEGAQQGRWVLLDFGDFVAHIFDEDRRRYYRLEDIWSDAPDVTGAYQHDAPASAQP